VLEETFISRT